jgi:hypothetical protein
MNRKSAWLITPLLLACIHLAEAQQPRNMPRIGWLSPSSPSLEPTPSRLKSFHQGLADLGYVEGKNITMSIDMRKVSSTGFRESPLSWCGLR